jgi:hypothetical protein
MATDLYQRVMGDTDPHLNINKRVWKDYPWLIDAFTGSHDDSRSREIQDWLHKEFGREGWALADRAGRWQRGSATVNGWTWHGFATREDMDAFLSRWGVPQVPGTIMSGVTQC